MAYKTTREVQFNGKTIAAGKPISFGDDDTAARDQLLALDPPAIVGSDEKPLAKMSKPELLAVAEAENIEIAEDATNAQIVAAIEAKRAGG